MPRYWVIAPYENQEIFDKVWQFDLENNAISIGNWGAAGDVSKMERDEIEKAVAGAQPNRPPSTKALIANMIWRFYREIAVGDFIIARKGLKILAGVGRVTARAEYIPGKNATIEHPNFLAVDWQEEPRGKVFPVTVFRMFTLAEISKDQFAQLTEGVTAQGASQADDATDEIALGPEQYVFALEKYLEEFIVSNFNAVFKKKMHVYEDTQGNKGQQYQTDVGPIDILAVEADSNSFIVIELKKARTSDQVVGQILRYMGWVKKNLCKDGQGVKGIVICREVDEKLSYALDMTKGLGIEIKYYEVKFSLSETSIPPSKGEA
jgi:endonuclease NucS-like protein